MRIVGGEFRSRRIKTVAGRAVRPTSDRLRETLFNIIGDEVAGKVFVDAYAGSGAVGIEALSRGAARAVFIEKDLKVAAVVRENLRALGIETRARVLIRAAAAALRDIDADIAFLDPPYDARAEYEAALAVLGDKPPGLVVAEHALRLELAPAYGDLHRVRKLRQGDSALSLYRRLPRRDAG